MENPNIEGRCGIEVAMSTSQIHRRELVQTLDGLKARVSAEEPGCACEFFEDLGRSNRFLWKEWWMTEKEADLARASDRFRALLGAVKVLGALEYVRRLSQQPDDEIETSHETHLEDGA